MQGGDRTLQRLQGLTASKSMAPMRKRRQASSVHPGAPVTTMLGRNRFIGSASAMPEFSSARDPYPSAAATPHFFGVPACFWRSCCSSTEFKRRLQRLRVRCSISADPSVQC